MGSNGLTVPGSAVNTVPFALMYGSNSFCILRKSNISMSSLAKLYPDQRDISFAAMYLSRMIDHIGYYATLPDAGREISTLASASRLSSNRLERMPE
jgi:hypothetical protein